MFFTVSGAGLFLGSQSIGGAVVYAVLAICTFMEGGLDFCVGCWCFGWGIYFGIVPKILYSPYINFRNYRIWANAYTNATVDYPVGPKEHVLLPGQKDPTPADLIRPVRLEAEVKLRLFNPIKYCRIDFFVVPMAIAALAYTWMQVGISTQWNTDVEYQTLFIVSVIIGLIILVLYLLRLFVAFNKCWKEWNHPIYSNMFSAPTITCVLWGIMFLPHSAHGGGALIWIGSIAQMFITLYKIQSLIFDRLPEEFINSALMISPVANFICAIGF